MFLIQRYACIRMYSFYAQERKANHSTINMDMEQILKNAQTITQLTVLTIKHVSGELTKLIWCSYAITPLVDMVLEKTEILCWYQCDNLPIIALTLLTTKCFYLNSFTLEWNIPYNEIIPDASVYGDVPIINVIVIMWCQRWVVLYIISSISHLQKCSHSIFKCSGIHGIYLLTLLDISQHNVIVILHFIGWLLVFFCDNIYYIFCLFDRKCNKDIF